MKSIRNLVTLIGLSVMLLALGVTGAKAQQSAGLSATEFGGTFTLTHEAVWGRMTLPSGNYSLYYGTMGKSGIPMVEVVGKSAGSPHGYILINWHNPTSAKTNSIVCVRDGGTLIVRALQMSNLGKSVFFSLPQNVRLTAHLRGNRTYAQLAEAPMLIERVPVTVNMK